jgi:tetratricopeptide (TPR) repeat protein
MTLLASVLRELENPSLSPNQRAQLRCEAARRLEDTGEYEAARDVIGELWDKSRLEGLERSTAAEVLLRAGVLTGWLGGTKDAQEAAKNLISESLSIFETLSYPKKTLEAQTELAYCYWREGGYGEARAVLNGVLEQLTADSELKAKAILRSAIVESSALRYSDALRIVTHAAPLFDKITNHTIRGGYHNELGLVLKNLAASERREDYIDRAFIEYEAASYHFEQAGHNTYRANVENNLGFLYFKAGRYTEAHEHLDRSRRILISIKDNDTAAQVNETRARVFIAQERYAEAERVARSAVRTLERGDRQSLLAEALTTHGVALARLGSHEQARLALFRAVEIAHQSGAINDAGLAALSAIEELSEYLSTDETQALFKRAYSRLAASQHLQTLQRLLHAASRVLDAQRSPQKLAGELDAKGTMREVIRRYEHRLVKEALERSEGSVTQAARLLGVSYQRLIYMLQSRHKDLLPKRTPARKRNRSIIKRKS